MFERWEVSQEYPTLFPLDRPVWIDASRTLPPSGLRQDQLPLWVRACGARVEPRLLGRQTAWLRRSDGGWIAVCEVNLSSANGRSTIATTLWLPPETITPALDT
ncbi:MAG: hypothetical protein QOE30_1246 [Mycobacterium sp.]|jgi:hypothetical protein|uniref:hypothetical protein n=1 Tax=Mycobacterium sp. TaxID=1785 RepID=UPI0028B3BD3C|nr:hypothetical protein [Mycobacterium sp.]MDT5115507.1 hypothetical protein [Mycobacterium sp.]